MLGYSQNIGDTFTDNYITYEITGLTPNTVKTSDYDVTGGTTVNIPASVTFSSETYNVTSIGNNSFQGKALTSATIPNSIIHIGDYAFYNNSLTSINIPNSVTTIDFAAFRSNSLTSVVIPNSVTALGNYTFRNNNLVSVTISENITLIRPHTFAYNNLTSITIPDNVTTIEGTAFGYNNITSVVIPNNVTYVGNFAFAYNQITTAILGSSLTTIEHGCFANYGNAVTLTDVTSLSTTPPTITTSGDGFDTFAVNRNTIHLHIPAGTTDAYVNDTGALWTGFNPVSEDAGLSVTDFELINDIKVITTSDKIKITSSNDIKLKNYSLYSITGSEITTGKEKEIPTSFLASGIYILKMNFDKGKVSKKIAVK